METTRELSAREKANWIEFKSFFDSVISPKIQALQYGFKAVKKLRDVAFELTGENVIDLANNEVRVSSLVRKMEAMDRCIMKVLTNRYGLQFDPASKEFAIVSPPINFDESDTVKFDGFGGILVLIGMITVVVAGVWGTVRIMEERTKWEVADLQYKMQKLNAHMATKTKEIQAEYKKNQQKTTEQIAEISKQLPGSGSLLSDLIGSKGSTIAIAAAIGIAALYFLSPKLRRN